MPKTASPGRTAEWVLPASIPFAELKGRDLEECVYWLLDAMGAKDLEWRTGGSGGGAADGGRDLEATFYTPTVDGEIEAQRWWIECKGRAGTVEVDQVKSAVTNALAVEGLSYVVIATNTQFSNPTRGWVRKWQQKYPRPLIKLWDHVQLERFLSRHPDVVLRLFAEALSLEGRLKALESRFWNKLEYVVPKTLADLWNARETIDFTPSEMFALVANEFAGGDIVEHPWAATFSTELLQDVLAVGMYNVAYFVMRSSTAGAEQGIVHRTFAYLVLAALERTSAENVAELVFLGLSRGEQIVLPEQYQDIILKPIWHQLLSEIQDVCTSNCRRMISTRRRTLTEGKDEIDDYWLRFELRATETTKDGRSLYLESLEGPCAVGFPVDSNNGCPLFHVEPKASTTTDLMKIIKRVAEFRKQEAALKRETDKERIEQYKRRTMAMDVT